MRRVDYSPTSETIRLRALVERNGATYGDAVSWRARLDALERSLRKEAHRGRDEV